MGSTDYNGDSSFASVAGYTALCSAQGLPREIIPESGRRERVVQHS